MVGRWCEVDTGRTQFVSRLFDRVLGDKMGIPTMLVLVEKSEMHFCFLKVNFEVIPHVKVVSDILQFEISQTEKLKRTAPTFPFRNLFLQNFPFWLEQKKGNGAPSFNGAPIWGSRELRIYGELRELGSSEIFGSTNWRDAFRGKKWI